MDDSFDDEDIRPPDEVIREQLQEDPRSEYEKDLEEAMYQSIESLKEEEKRQDEYAQRCVQIFEEERNQKYEQFDNIFKQLKKLSVYDMNLKNILDIMEPVIDAYCNGFIEYYGLDKISHDNIFDNLKKVRLSEEERQILKNIVRITEL
jgi:hypothetical protein